MSEQTVNILAVVLGFLGVLTALIAILVQVYLSKWTNKMIEREDERAKKMIDEGNRRYEKLSVEIMKMIDEGNRRHEELIKETQKMINEGNERLEKILLQIDKSTKEILAEILKKVST